MFLVLVNDEYGDRISLLYIELKMHYQQQILNAILRTDLKSFIHKAFVTINPSAQYIPNWHIDLISEYLENIHNGSIKRLIINMPPRSLKSVCVSVAFPAWLLGINPYMRILTASYAQHLSIKHSMDTRFVMSANWYKELFPNTILSEKHNKKDKFMTTCHGFRFATSTGGSVTGEGGDILIIDDPHNPTYIYSRKKRMHAIEWFEQTFSTRLNNRAHGAIILVMQRLHNEDLSGHLISSQSNMWETLKIPAAFDEDCVFSTKKSQYKLTAGSFLHETRWDKESLAITQREIGFHNFAAQYMQSPISGNDSMLQESDLSYIDYEPENFEYCVQSWDTAIKISHDSDYSVCTTWLVKGDLYYLKDIFRKRVSYPELKSAAEKLYSKYKPHLILIEDKASGSSLIQDLRNNGISGIIAENPKLDKVTRFASIIPLFQSGNILLPKNAAWRLSFLEEVSKFPNSQHDDIIDSISQFLRYIKKYKIHLRIRAF